jgi:crossover junction endodeoxyribonuclease RuvC
MRLAAFDPGLAGALCILDGTAVLHLDDLPTYKAQHGQRARVRVELDLHRLAALLKEHAPMHCYIEAVHSMPRQGISSTFRFGESFGQLQGIIVALGILLTLVRPQDWQRHHRIGAERDGYRQRAVQLFPDVAERSHASATIIVPPRSSRPRRIPWSGRSRPR